MSLNWDGAMRWIRGQQRTSIPFNWRTEITTNRHENNTRVITQLWGKQCIYFNLNAQQKLKISFPKVLPIRYKTHYIHHVTKNLLNDIVVYSFKLRSPDFLFKESQNAKIQKLISKTNSGEKGSARRQERSRRAGKSGWKRWCRVTRPERKRRGEGRGKWRKWCPPLPHPPLPPLPAALCRLGVHGGWAEWKAQPARGEHLARHQLCTVARSPPSQHSPNTQALAIKTTPNKHTPNTLTTCGGAGRGTDSAEQQGGLLGPCRPLPYLHLKRCAGTTELQLLTHTNCITMQTVLCAFCKSQMYFICGLKGVTKYFIVLYHIWLSRKTKFMLCTLYLHE